VNQRRFHAGGAHYVLISVQSVLVKAGEEGLAVTAREALLLDDPWQVQARDFPKAESACHKLCFLLNYASLAPSILNTQPWCFRLRGDTVALYADLSRMLPVTDPDGRELTISCGAALFNLRLAAHSFGHEVTVAVLPDDHRPDLLAEAKLGSTAGTATERQLREAITRQHTNRGNFEGRPLSSDLIESLSRAADDEGAMLTIRSDAEDKRRVSQLVGEAERLLVEDPAFRTKMSEWIANRLGEAYDSEAQQRLDSSQGSAGRTPELRSRPELDIPAATGIVRAFARGEATIDNRARTIEGAPVLTLLTTNGDTSVEWLKAGAALQRVLLVATAARVSVSYLSSAIEVDRTRRQLAQAFRATGAPQVLLRLGYGLKPPPAPRRPTREVVS
jgi:hypothetical protein